MADHDIAWMSHLLRRAGFGAPREELEARAAKGYEATVEELLNPKAQEIADRDEMMRYHPFYILKVMLNWTFMTLFNFIIILFYFI